MTLPQPAALLVDHPALPLPCAVVVGVGPDLSEVKPIEGLRLEQRQRLAVQLVAATALLAEFDLWPGRAALRRAGWVAEAGSVRALVAGFPRYPVPIPRAPGGRGAGERAHP